MKLSTQTQILDRKDYLQRTSQISFAYSKLESNIDFQKLSENEAQELLSAYDNLLKKVIDLAEELKSLGY